MDPKDQEPAGGWGSTMHTGSDLVHYKWRILMSLGCPHPSFILSLMLLLFGYRRHRTNSFVIVAIGHRLFSSFFDVILNGLYCVGGACCWLHSKIPFSFVKVAVPLTLNRNSEVNYSNHLFVLIAAYYSYYLCVSELYSLQWSKERIYFIFRKLLQIQ